MEKLAGVLAAAGGFAGLGGFIDFMLRARDRKRLENWLVEWWIRFDDVKWQNFGQKEAGALLDFLDRQVGRRFFSARRWRFVATVAATLLVFNVLALTLTQLWVYWFSGKVPAAAKVHGFLFLLAGYWRGEGAPATNLLLAGIVVGITITFAASFTVMRWLAGLVRSMNLTGLPGLLFFCLLLVIQLLVLLYWNTIALTLILVLPAYLYLYAPHWDKAVTDSIHNIVRDLGPADRLGQVLKPLAFWDARGLGPDTLVTLYKSELDLIANGLRIFFALAFFASFLFQPVLKPFISRLWEGVIESKKPLFAMLFGGVAVFVGALAALFR